MKKVIASIAAAGILVAGAFTASAITGSEASAQTEETTTATDEVQRPQPGHILDGVLSDLVEDGTDRSGRETECRIGCQPTL